LQRDFDMLSDVANTVPMYLATIPLGPPFAPDVAPSLAALVA
jgi:hypothetical protein